MAEKTKKSAGAAAVKVDLRAMPKNYEAEQAVLGSMLIDKDAADMILSRLTDGDFFSEQNAVIFRAAKTLLKQNDPIDTVTVADKLEKDRLLEDAGGIAYISGLAAAIPSAANAEYYAEIVQRDGLLRELIRAGNQITKKAYEATDAKAALSKAESIVFNLADDRDTSEFMDISQASSAAIEEIEKIQSGNDARKIVKTGFERFDKITGGFKSGDFVLVAARPSVGKTALALNIAANAALDGNKTVAIFSLEMPTIQLVKRMLSYVSSVSMGRMNESFRLSRPEMRALYDAHERLNTSRIFIDDSSMVMPSDILSKCRRLKRSGAGLDLVVIDYLQLMKVGDGRSPESRQQEVSEMSRMMKIYAKELDVPMLVLSQMSRGVEQRTEHEPKLSDLRDSGAIEQDADMVIFLHKPALYNKNLNPNEVELRVAKNRNGPLGEVYLDWDGERTAFTEKDKSDNTEQRKEISEDKQVRESVFASPASIAVEAVKAERNQIFDGDMSENSANALARENDKMGMEKTANANNVDIENLSANGEPLDGESMPPSSVMNEPGDQKIDSLASEDLPF